MSNTLGILPAGATWLLECWLEKITGVIESMTEEHPSMTWVVDGDDELGENALILEQRFTSVPEPMLWIGVPQPVHQDLGSRVLAAAGIENSEADENRATCLEMIEQSIGGLAGALTKRMSREITRESAPQIPTFPRGLSVIRVTIMFGEISLAPLWIAIAPLLVSWIETKPHQEQAQAPRDEASSELSTPVALPPSRTFELLLDVALPVSVSFGKAELTVRDILKLTTGSIVELNRSVHEPVDIIVNNCIIARGQVVVVEGNYGVRILSIVSRKERLRTGGAAVVETRARLTGN